MDDREVRLLSAISLVEAVALRDECREGEQEGERERAGAARSNMTTTSDITDDQDNQNRQNRGEEEGEYHGRDHDQNQEQGQGQVQFQLSPQHEQAAMKVELRIFTRILRPLVSNELIAQVDNNGSSSVM